LIAANSGVVRRAGFSCPPLCTLRRRPKLGGMRGGGRRQLTATSSDLPRSCSDLIQFRSVDRCLVVTRAARAAASPFIRYFSFVLRTALTNRGMVRTSLYGVTRRCSHPILEFIYSRCMCAMCATVDSVADLRTVTEHRAATMSASRSKRVNGAFKAIEDVMDRIGRLNREGLVVVVPAGLANRHVTPHGRCFAECRWPQRLLTFQEALGAFLLLTSRPCL
jgi:hypothetical protein